MSEKKLYLNSSDISFIKNLIHEAGLLAKSIQKGDMDLKRKDDSSIVTRADFEVQEMLISGLSSRFPGMKFIHEENFDPDALKIDDDSLYAIIDPVDGTAMFSMRLPIWCVSVGIFRGAVPAYGFVFAPSADMFFYNDESRAYLNDEPVKAVMIDKVDSETNIFFASEVKGIFSIDFPGKIRNLGSTAFHAALLADNRRNRSLAFAGMSMIWDWAGAIPVLLKAGTGIQYLNGNEIDFRKVISNGCVFQDFVIAYNTENFEKVRDYFIPILPHAF